MYENKPCYPEFSAPFLGYIQKLANKGKCPFLGHFS